MNVVKHKKVDQASSKALKILTSLNKRQVQLNQGFNPSHTNNAYMRRKHRSGFYELLLV